MEEGRRKSIAAAFYVKEEGRWKKEDVSSPSTTPTSLLLFIFFTYCFLIKFLASSN